MKTTVTRVYDYTSPHTGSVILIDRLWPRGINRAQLAGVEWVKELTPSNELRTWYHEDKEQRFAEFEEKYLAELEGNQEELSELAASLAAPVLLLTSVKDIEHSHVPTLQRFLESLKT